MGSYLLIIKGEEGMKIAKVSINKVLHLIFALLVICGVFFISDYKIVEANSTVSESVESPVNEEEKENDENLKNGDVFIFNKEKWVMIEPENGFSMMEKSVDELTKDIELDTNDPIAILDYLDITYYKEIDEKERELMKKPTFGLVEYEDALHVTAEFKTDLIKTSDSEDNNTKEKEENVGTNEVKEEQSSSSTTKYVLLVGVIGLIVAIVTFVVSRKKQQSK